MTLDYIRGVGLQAPELEPKLIVLHGKPNRTDKPLSLRQGSTAFVHCQRPPLAERLQRNIFLSLQNLTVQKDVFAHLIGLFS